MVHLVTHGIAQDSDKYRWKGLPCAKLGGLNVRIGLFGDEDVGDLAVAEIDMVLEGEGRCTWIYLHALFIINIIIIAKVSNSYFHQKQTKLRLYACYRKNIQDLLYCQYFFCSEGSAQQSSRLFLNIYIYIIRIMAAKLPLFIILFILLALVPAKPLIGSKVILALNCGSKDQQVQYLDKTFKYKADEPFVTGKSVDVDYHTNDEAKETDIKFTFEKRLYMYERHTYEQMTYSLLVKPGKVTLILKFAEMYFRNPGERVFNIKIGSRVVRQDFDVVQETGSRYAAHEQYIEIDIQKDGLYFEGSKIPGALTGNKLKLSFVKGKADNPIIQGIIVYHDSVQNSPKAEYLSVKEKWETQKEIQKAMKEEQALKDVLAVQKKKEKIVIRNDQLIVQKAQEKTQVKAPQEKYGFIRRLAMGPVGILLWSAAITITFQLLYRKVFLISSDKKQKAE